MHDNSVSIYEGIKPLDCKYSSIVRNYINETGIYVATEEEKVHSNASSEVIMNWIKEKLNNTVATVLIYDDKIFESKYVKYELEQSIKRNNSIIVLSLSDDLEKTIETINNSNLINCNSLKFFKFSDISSKIDIFRILQDNV